MGVFKWMGDIHEAGGMRDIKKESLQEQCPRRPELQYVVA